MVYATTQHYNYQYYGLELRPVSAYSSSFSPKFIQSVVHYSSF
jgi:hypothetical protein